jgi:hypothetical protein
VLTSAADDYPRAPELAGVRIERQPAPATTSMEHIWRGRVREQFVRARAAPIGPAAVPGWLAETPIVLFGSVIGELDTALLDAFPVSLRGATLQGWLRRIGEDGHVEAIAPAASGIEALLPGLHAAFLSEEDLGAPVAVLQSLLDRWARCVPVLAVTHGDLGALLAVDGVWHEIGVFPAHEVEATGAGDAFAAAFLIRYHETAGERGERGDAAEAARFAAASASFVVEQRGVASAATRAQVEARLAAHPRVRLRPLRG